MNCVVNTSDNVTDCSSQESAGSKRKSKTGNGDGSRARKRPRQQSYKIADVIDSDVSIDAIIVIVSFLSTPKLTARSMPIHSLQNNLHKFV